MAERHNSLSATNLAAYHHLNCDLYLHHVYHKHTQPTTPEGFDRSGDQLLVESQYQRGLNWEATLYSWLDQSDLLLKVPGLPLQADVLLENILADEREHFFIAGITYTPPQYRLQERFFRAGTEPVEFGTGKPDLVEIRRDGHGITWKVIDAKASKVVKTSHHVQIYFYTLCLEYLLDHPSFYSSGSAGIWLPPEEGFNLASPSLSDIKSIQMSLLSRSLDAFLFERLPRLLSVPREDVRWHFNPLCQGCKYNPECRVNAVSEEKLGSMPNVSIPDARVLQDMLSSSGRSGSDIEDLHRLVSEDLPKIEQKFPIVAKKGKRILGIRRKKVSDKYSAQVSPILESARAGRVEVIPRRNFTCPASEDVAVVVSLVQDPASPKSQVEFFAISLFTSTPQVYSGTGDRLIPTLAIIIDTLASSDLTTQFYVWSSAEQVLLQSHLIQQALVNSDLNPVDVRLCIGALSQGASLLQTAFQPVLLSGALLSFLVKGRRLKADYQACLERMGLSTRGTVPELRARVDQELKKLQHLSQHTGHQHEFGQVPRVIVLKKELEGMLAFPIAGYWDLRECAECLGGEDVEKEKADVPTDEEVFAAFKNDGTARLLGLLTDRNAMVNMVLNAARRRVCQAGQNLLVNGGKILTTDFMDMCRQDDLRKLFFMQQFEVLSKLNELWSSRMGTCPDAPVLEYCGKAARGVGHTFTIVSGVVDVPSTDRGMSFFDYLLAEDVSSETEIPVEAMFDDLAVSGVVIPPNRSTKLHWDSQHPRVKENVLLADLRNISSVNGKLVVNVQTYGTPTNQILVHGRHYRLSPRLVDFNTTKVLSSLFELDLRWGDRERNAYEPLDRSIESAGHRGVPFLQLIMDPKSFGRVPEAKELLVTEDNTQRVFRNLKNLDVAAAASLLLKSSQHRATQRLLANRLAVIWGPPGTGKTHTIALSILRLLEAEWKLGVRRQKVIFLTAMTHAAIDACQGKLTKIIDCYRSIEHLDLGWLDDVRVERVMKASDHTSPPRTSTATYVYAGTLYQLYNFTKSQSIEVDCVIADEAGQIALASLSLVLRCLSPTGRIIIAGDSEQLAPIFTGAYPRLKTAPLFGSVLDCVMFSQGGPVIATGSQSQGESQDDGGHTVIQLTENFRLNPDLGEFVATIYSRQFKPQKAQSRSLALKLTEIVHMSEANKGTHDLGVNRNVLRTVQVFLLGLSDVMLRRPQSVLKPPRFSGLKMPIAEMEDSPTDPNHQPVSLSLLRLRTWSSTVGQQFGYETHVHGEAALTASLVAALRYCTPDDNIFVATPHRVQREAVKAALARLKRPDQSLEDRFERLGEQDGYLQNVTVDTVERLQGSEASFVICLFSLPELHSADLGFLLGRRRLNVAISRAKTLCILITSTQVLCPPVSVFANEETGKGYAFLKAYEDRAWSYDVSVDIGAL